MKHLKRYTIIGIIFVLIAGTIDHFLYDLSNHNHIIGFFAPVNESVWEHIKLLFFPMLIYSLFAITKLKPQYPCITSALCFGILIGVLLIPVIYYVYTFILGRNFLILDMGVFAVSVVIAFCISYKCTLSCKLQPYTFILCISVCVLLICFFLFTYHAPNIAIFQDPSDSTS